MSNLTFTINEDENHFYNTGKDITGELTEFLDTNIIQLVFDYISDFELLDDPGEYTIQCYISTESFNDFLCEPWFLSFNAVMDEDYNLSAVKPFLWDCEIVFKHLKVSNSDKLYRTMGECIRENKN